MTPIEAALAKVKFNRRVGHHEATQDGSLVH